MYPKRVILGLGLLVGGTLYWQLGEAEEALQKERASLRQGEERQTLPTEIARRDETSRESTAALQPTLGELPPNDRAPDPQMLAGRPDLQEAFDAAAEPGEFVTPPSVSIE